MIIKNWMIAIFCISVYGCSGKGGLDLSTFRYFGKDSIICSDKSILIEERLEKNATLLKKYITDSPENSDAESIFNLDQPTYFSYRKYEGTEYLALLYDEANSQADRVLIHDGIYLIINASRLELVEVGDFNW